MILLHIAHIDNNKFSGVNVAVKSFIEAQSKTEQVALLNVAKIRTIQLTNEFLFKSYSDINSLPFPFNKPDLIIFHEIYRPDFLKIYRQALKLHIPYIIVPHGGLTRKAQSIKRIKKLVANFLLFDKFINSSTGVQYLSEHEFNESRYKKSVFIETNGIDSVYPKNIFSKSIKRIVYIGRLDIYIKGLDLLLQAVKNCKKELLNHNVTIKLYGPDENECHKKIREQISLLKIGNIISVHDSVSGETKKNILYDADCFIQTSRSEGMSMGILEAFSYGLPCILTEGTSLTEITREYNAGWTCDTSASAISKTLLLAITSSDISEKSFGAISLIKNNFLLDKITRNTILRYKNIVSTFNEVT